MNKQSCKMRLNFIIFYYLYPVRLQKYYLGLVGSKRLCEIGALILVQADVTDIGTCMLTASTTVILNNIYVDQNFIPLFGARYLYNTFTNGQLLRLWLIGLPPI